MPLKKGQASIRSNVAELTENPVLSSARKKAIATLARKHNISIKEATFKQALAIAKSQARKR